MRYTFSHHAEAWMAVRGITAAMVHEAFRRGMRSRVHAGLLQVDAPMDGLTLRVIARPVKGGYHIVSAHFLDL